MYLVKGSLLSYQRAYLIPDYVPYRVIIIKNHSNFFPISHHLPKGDGPYLNPYSHLEWKLRRRFKSANFFTQFESFGYFLSTDIG